MTFEPYPPASAIGGDHAFFDTVAEMQSAVLANGDQCHTAGYLAVGDGGGSADGYTYHDAGQSGETEDGGFVIFGGGADDWFEANNKTVANVRRFGAVNDGADDIPSLQAAVDAHPSVLFPAGLYGYSTALLLAADNAVLSGYGATLISVDAAADQGINISGSNCHVHGLTVDGNGGVITPTGRGAGIRVEGDDAHIFQCTVQNLNNATSAANGIYVLGARAHIDDCTIENAGYYSIRLDGLDGLATKCRCRYTAQRAGSLYRWLGSNQMVGTQAFKDCELFCDQAVETSNVFDVESTPQPGDRHLIIDGLNIDHANYTVGANDHCIKTADVRAITINNVTSNMHVATFLRSGWAHPNLLAADALNVTADFNTDTFTNPSPHFLKAGQGLSFTGTPPTGFVVGTTYYAIQVTSTTFKLAADWSGFDPIVLSDNGGAFEIRPQNTTDDIKISNSHFYGAVSGESTGNIRRLVIDGCTWIGDDQDQVRAFALENVKEVRRIIIKNTTIRQFEQMTNVFPLNAEGSITVDQVRWEYSGTGNKLLFPSMSRMGEVINLGLTIVEQNTGRVYLSQTSGRMWATYDGHAMHYNHLMSKYYESPLADHIGVTGGRCGHRTTSATSDTRQWSSSVFDANFPGVEGDVLINDEPGNVEGYGWQFNGTNWIAI